MRRTLTGVIDFVVGDDVWTALAVVVAVVATGVVVRAGVDAWWLLSVVVPLAMFGSVRRASSA